MIKMNCSDLVKLFWLQLGNKDSNSSVFKKDTKINPKFYILSIYPPDLQDKFE